MNIIFNIFKVLLDYMFYFTGDWGVSIVTLTMFVKLVLCPLSLKQKFSFFKQHKLGKKFTALKEKYRGNNKKLNEELKKYYGDNVKSMMGCLVTFIQIPIIGMLYSTFINMPLTTGTILVPWIVSLKLNDSYFIIPIIYALVSTFPVFMNYVDYLNIYRRVNQKKSEILIPAVMGALISFKAPVAIGLYFISSALFSVMEDVLFRIYVKKKGFV